MKRIGLTAAAVAFAISAVFIAQPDVESPPEQLAELATPRTLTPEQQARRDAWTNARQQAKAEREAARLAALDTQGEITATGEGSREEAAEFRAEEMAMARENRRKLLAQNIASLTEGAELAEAQGYQQRADLMRRRADMLQERADSEG